MKLFVLIFAGLMLSGFQALAQKPPVKAVQNSRDWQTFESTLAELRKDDKIRGVSYIVSGALVTVGGLVAAGSTDDPATKLVYGITTSAGVGAVAYGVSKLSFGNEYNSFYDAVRLSSLAPAQRDILVQNYLQNEEDRKRRHRRIATVAHLVAGTINLYSATREKDSNAKTFFGVLAGLNFAVGISYAF